MGAHENVCVFILFTWLSTVELKLVPCVPSIHLCRLLIIIQWICVAQLIINSKYNAPNKPRVCKKEKKKRKKKEKKKDKSQHLAKGGE